MQLAFCAPTLSFAKQQYRVLRCVGAKNEEKWERQPTRAQVQKPYITLARIADMLKTGIWHLSGVDAPEIYKGVRRNTTGFSYCDLNTDMFKRNLNGVTSYYHNVREVNIFLGAFCSTDPLDAATIWQYVTTNRCFWNTTDFLPVAKGLTERYSFNAL